MSQLPAGIVMSRKFGTNAGMRDQLYAPRSAPIDRGQSRPPTRLTALGQVTLLGAVLRAMKGSPQIEMSTSIRFRCAQFAFVTVGTSTSNQ
jgi:hypothetical protein